LSTNPLISTHDVTAATRAGRPLRATLVVVGDLGRSPRMLYHALALAARSVRVDLLGYADSDLPVAVRSHPLVTIRDLPGTRGPVTVPASRGQYVRQAARRGAGVAWSLTRMLFWDIPRPDILLVQNPPGVPALPVAWAAARCRGSRLVVDWHNLTGSMLGLRLGKGSPLVRLATWLERSVGRHADTHLFVSQAMADALGSGWGLDGVVMRDRPAPHFAPLDAVARSDARRALFRQLPGTPSDAGLVVCPTGWTADEDLDLLLSAVATWDEVIRRRRERPHPAVVVLVTGRGPMRAAFESRAAARAPSPIQLRTTWLDPETYARTLACADVGLCLHRSASGLDLPMKVADLLGAGVPVCALDDGTCLTEVLRQGDNGLLFRDAAGLARHLEEVFRGFPRDLGPLPALSPGVDRSRAVNWFDGWLREAWPAIRGVER
jgi:beta-1,4-mannosyltransferase